MLLSVVAVALAVLAAPTVATAGVGTGTAGPSAAVPPTGSQPQTSGNLTISPSTVDFGTVAVGDSATRTITIANDSPDPVTVANVRFTGNARGYEIVSPEAFTGDLGDGITVPTGIQQSVTLQLAPRVAGDYSGTVVVTNPNGTTIAELDIEGKAIAPDIAVSPQSLTFDDATVGDTAIKTVTVTNRGEASLSIESAAVEGAGVYSLRSVGDRSVAPGESTQVTVAFTPDSTRSRSATLSIETNDPDEPDVLVYLSNTDTELRVSGKTERSRTGSGPSTQRVNVSVSGVEAGQQITVPMPDSGDENETAAMETVSVETSVSGSFSLNVTKSQNASVLENEFEAGDNATGLLHLDVRKSLTNEQIQSVGFTYRVRKSVLENSSVDPEDVVMYRHEDAGWVEKNTTLTRETDRYYVFRTNASGFSEWTAAAQHPSIEVAEARTNLTAATVGDTAAIEVTLTNTGGADGVYVTKLLLNGTVVEEREITVPDGGTVLVRFLRPFEQPGIYRVTVNDVPVGVINVTESKSVEVSTSTPAGSTDSGGDTGENSVDGGADTTPASVDSGDATDSPGDGSSADSPAAVDAGGSDAGGSSGFVSGMLPLFGVGALVLLGVLAGLLYVRSGEGEAGSSETSTTGTTDTGVDDGDVVELEGYDDAEDESKTATDDGGSEAEDEGRADAEDE